MTKRIMLAGTAALALLAMGTATRADACFQCTSAQWCTVGMQGSSCEIYTEGGRQWCQHTLDCHAGITMTPLEVSPAGTYLARGGAQVTEDDVEKQACNGFIVRHLAGGGRAHEGLAIQI
ncbi:MAG TPA: hypothetical protein VFT45_03035 [Longimicrobium sp.]|nr:hypothetical protein [Longimicrobium sp.]